eukprot:CAMPEP_0201544158 /NCGR_PEP_ID=MMETSP0173_2-20130828/708_1 /ASSEMBLY_ACC=CAM_ASM_000268 /TAXON_ID=218659 /ORGANISM="Vexillifera sp., Strain DIVA3 564/2" /LENGTH=1049 /DNA_ID=CAMNT_0047952189 /DNA_START=291 /DNA_END=3440 /DNA_ORIENTATION=-
MWIYEQLGGEIQQRVKTVLCGCMLNETTEHIRSMVGDAISELAVSLLPKGGWNDFLPFLLKCIASSNPGHRKVAYDIFAHLGVWLGEHLQPHFPRLQKIFSNGLKDPQLKCRIAALKAVASILPVMHTQKEFEMFAPLVPVMIETILSAIKNGFEMESREALEQIVELIESEPRFIKRVMLPFFQSMIKVAQSFDDLEDQTRHMAMETLITIAEVKPGLAKKTPKFTQCVISLLLRDMIDQEDNDKWNQGKKFDMEDDNADFGEESLDRVALALGATAVLPVLFSLIPSYFNNRNSWQSRSAALISLSIVAEGCSDKMSARLDQIVKEMICVGLKDPHPRVRWAAVNVIGQFSTDFGPNFQKIYHNPIVPALIHIMDDKNNPRVQAHAASAVVNFSDKCDPAVLKGYLKPLLTKLLQLTKSPIIVQEQVVTAVASIADCVEEEFSPYYNGFLPFFKTVLVKATAKEHRRLRGKTLEAISLIGLAVGRKVFLPEANALVQLMFNIQNSLEDDDPTQSFMQQAWVRIAKCLGPEFVRYLPKVMPPLLKSASIPPETEVHDGHVNGSKEGWEYVSIANKTIGINTTVLLEKCTAVNMLYCYADDLKELFFPYVQDVAKIMVPLLTFYYHDETRASAATSVAALMRSVAAHARCNKQPLDNAHKLLQYILPELLEAISNEPDLEILTMQIESLAECIGAAGPNALSQENIDTVSKLCQIQLTDLNNRIHARQQRRKDEDFDEQDAKKIAKANKREWRVMGQIGEVCGSCFKNYGHHYFPIFNKYLAPMWFSYLAPNQSPFHHQIALCVLDEVLEYGQQAADAAAPKILPILLKSALSADHRVRQAAVFGLGVAAQHTPKAFTKVLKVAVNNIVTVITAKEARSDRYVRATENAVSALGKVLLFHTKQLGDQFAPLVRSFIVDCLPVSVDDIESKVIYNQLCTLIDRHHKLAFGANNANLPHILKVFASIMYTKLIDNPLFVRIVKQIQTMKASVQGFEQVFNSLDKPLQQKIINACAQGPPASPSRPGAGASSNSPASTTQTDSASSHSVNFK